MVILVSGLISELAGQIANALCVTPSLTIEESPGGDHEDEGGEEDFILIVISTENKKGHLLLFSTLLTLCEGSYCNCYCHCPWLLN